MAKRDDDVTGAQQGGDRGDTGRTGDDLRGTGLDDIRGIANDEDDDFEDADDLDDADEDEEEGI